MNEYRTIDEMFHAACKQILNDGHNISSRDGGSREIMGYCGRLLNPTANFLINPIRKLSTSYAAAEFLWYLSGTNNIDMIKAYAPQYERFTEDGETAWGAYGYRWSHDPSYVQEALKHYADFNFPIDEFICDDKLKCPLSQIQTVAWLLKRNIHTRQAIVSMWNAGDLIHSILGDKHDLPCTLALNFLVRDNTLFLTATMRSNDVWLGFPYDIWCFTNLQNLIADILGLNVGWYQHQAMSLHVYDRNLEKFNKVCDSPCHRSPSFCYTSIKHSDSRIKLSELMRVFLYQEKITRKNEKFDYENLIKVASSASLLGQCLIMACSKWDFDSCISRIVNRELQNYMSVKE